MLTKDSRPDLQGLSRKPSDLKLHNQHLVVSLLKKGCPLSASELAAQSSLSKTTVSKILAKLCHQNIVSSAGKGDSTSEGGKKPELFILNPKLAVTIVLSLFRRSVLRCAIIDFGGEILYQKDVAITPEEGYPNLRDQAISCILDAIAVCETTQEHVCGIVISYTGIANAATGEILYPIQTFQSQYYPLRQDLMSQIPLDVPVFLDNACNYSGYAELLFDDNAAFDELCIMSFGEIVSGCILQLRNGIPRRRGIAGEFGHYILDPSSEDRCYCGCRGCLDTLLSITSVLNHGRQMSSRFPFSQTARRLEQGLVDIDELTAAANNNDFFAQEVLLRSIRYLALLIQNCCSLTTVSKVIIQGFYARTGTYFRQRLQEELEKSNHLHIHGDIVLEFSRYSEVSSDNDEYACIRGAGFFMSNLYLERLLSEL